MDSLANPNKPVPAAHTPDSNIEMSWDIFAGELSVAILGAFYVRAAKDGVTPTRPEMSAYFRSHLERGILQLHGAATLVELCKRNLQPKTKS